MINLIPPEGKKAVVREYWIRVVSVWAFLLSGACIAVGLLLIPAYVLINVQLDALQGEIREGNDSAEEFAFAEAGIRKTNATIDQLNAELPATDIADIVRAVNEAADADIQLRRFQISRAGLVVQQFQIQGVAATRESLAQFKTALERLPLFESVVLPISDLASDANLPFAVTITLSTVYQ